MHHDIDVAIVGGGIAGLALALNLHARKIPCQVFEAVPEVREVGVGITLLPHAMRELTALGLREEIAACGIENIHSKFYNRFGQLVFNEPRGKYAGYSYPEYGIHRGKLHGVLYRAACERLGPEAVKRGRRCVGFEQATDGVTLSFDNARGASQRSVTAKALIGCDGVNSTIRRAFYPNESVVFSGVNTWRGVTRRKPILDGRTYLRIGSFLTGSIVIYPIVDYDDGSGDQLINWVAQIPSEATQKNDWNKRANAEDFVEFYREWVYDWLDIPALIRGADAVLEYPMVDKDPIDRWTFGDITLAGDAAHPMYPRGSNGSAQALIDVRVLSDVLATAKHGQYEEALRAYEKARRPATTQIVQTNRATPPDIVIMKVEELTQGRPFANLDDFITQDELKALSDRYKKIAGFGLNDVGRNDSGS